MSIEGPLRGGQHQPLSLIETLRYDPSLGCIRAERHLERMTNSSLALGKQFDLERAAHDLRAIGASTPLRVRLVLDQRNHLTLETFPFTPLVPQTIWRVAIARTKLDAGNPLLAHKTSLREQYEAARAEYSISEIDEVLLENQHGHLCEGTITNLFVKIGDRLVTPPLQDGLLKGVLRQEMLDEGKAVEGIVSRQDLVNNQFFVGNSLRNLIEARLIN
jgi:4-amino-4-deoxychorismate lyase